MADKLNSLNFTFVARSAPSNGPSSSDAWNDSFFELATDFASLASEWNNKLVAVFDTLPKGELDTSVNVFQNGLDGKTIWVDSSVNSGDNDLTYFDSSKDRPVTIQEAFQNLYQYVDSQLEQTLENALDAASGLTTDQKNAIGANIFDNSQTSTATSLDGKSERNRLNTIQIANDVYGPSYILGNNGNAQLTNSVFAMVDALLELHNGNWDDDITLSHTGSFTAIQNAVSSSAPGNDSFSGSPNNLEEDLNQIRTEIKNTKGTAGWLTSTTALYGGGASTLEALLVSTQGTGSKTSINPWGYNYSDVDGLETRLNSIGTFTGQTSQVDTSPAYSGVNYINSGDSLVIATGKLDLALDTLNTTVVGHNTHLNNLLTFTGQSSSVDFAPQYISTTYVNDSDSLELAVGKLDQGLTVLESELSFSGLNDTPATFSGNQYNPLRVNVTESEIEFDESMQITPSGLYHSGNITAASGIVSEGGDVEVETNGFGLILSSPNGTRWRIEVDNAGTLTTTSL